jgi:type I restriction enzyme R subunit
LKEVVEDLVRHFEERTALVEGKGMIVSMSREICVHLYNEVIKLRPQWHDADPEKGAIKIIMTGFDAPSCHTMYVDKPMRGHNLMQALKIYATSQGKGTPTLRAEEALASLLEKLDVVRGMLHGFDYSDYHTRAHQILVLAAISRAFTLCSTLDEAATLRKEIAFFAAIKAACHRQVHHRRHQAPRRGQELGPQADPR